MLKKIPFFTAFIFFLSCLSVSATCRYSGDSDFRSCMGNPTSKICFLSNGITPYACCDTVAETCPAVPTSTSAANPPSPTPHAPTTTPKPGNTNGDCDPVYGCFGCDYDSGSNTCFWNPSQTNQCNFPYFADKNACSAYSGVNNEPTCRRILIPCVDVQATYYCSPSVGCDITCSTGDCGTVTYSSRGQCLTACNTPPLACLSNGGRECMFENQCETGSSVGPGFGCAPGLVCCLRDYDPLIPPWFCDVSGNTAGGIDTGLGCATFCAGTFAANALGWSSLTVSGIAFIIILVAVGMFITSGGDSKKIQAAKELLYSALGGLFLIAIGIVLLNTIGVNILKLNTLGFKLDATCKPITFEKTPPTPTPRPPTPKPISSPTRHPTPKSPTVIPSPTRVPPTITPKPCYECCTKYQEGFNCKKPSIGCGNPTAVMPGNCTYNIGKNTYHDGIKCQVKSCIEKAGWCFGDPKPASCLN